MDTLKRPGAEPFPSLITGSSADVPSEADVVIVGSGISGAFAAREMFQNALARERRPRVVMFEAREVCSGASGRVGEHESRFSTTPAPKTL